MSKLLGFCIVVASVAYAGGLVLGAQGAINETP